MDCRLHHHHYHGPISIVINGRVTRLDPVRGADGNIPPPIQLPIPNIPGGYLVLPNMTVQAIPAFSGLQLVQVIAKPAGTVQLPQPGFDQLAHFVEPPQVVRQFQVSTPSASMNPYVGPHRRLLNIHAEQCGITGDPVFWNTKYLDPVQLKANGEVFPAIAENQVVNNVPDVTQPDANQMRFILSNLHSTRLHDQLPALYLWQFRKDLASQRRASICLLGAFYGKDRLVVIRTFNHSHYGAFRHLDLCWTMSDLLDIRGMDAVAQAIKDEPDNKIVQHRLFARLMMEVFLVESFRPENGDSLMVRLFFI